jgi:hypothetical protein
MYFMYQLMLQPLCCVYTTAKIASCRAVCKYPYWEEGCGEGFGMQRVR